MSHRLPVACLLIFGTVLLIGALAALLFLGRAHDRQLSRLNTG